MENGLESQKIEIQEPSVALKDSYLSALKEYHNEGRHLEEDEEELGKHFSNFIDYLKRESQGIDLKPGRVAQSMYWIIDEDGYAGRVSIRHELNEKLLELHSIKVSIETTRKLMIECDAWHPNRKKRPAVHQQRTRRSRLGELVQIDGSPHLWFEDRGEPCCLITFVDDATGQAFGMFFKTETCAAYMITLAGYRLKYKGLPNCFYSDKYGVFRINRPGCVNKEQLTQFGRICKELGIGLICANSAPAKGRVERMNQTQQDRLTKELRLAGICNIQDGNEFLKTYWDPFNKKFNVLPASTENSHLAPLSDTDFYRILCFKETRTVTKNLEIQYKNTIYQVVNKASKGLYRAKITVLESLNGEISFEYKNKKLELKKFSEITCAGAEVSPKEIDRFLKEYKDQKKASKNSPWSRGVKKKPAINF